MLQEADFVVLAAPTTDSTRRLMNAERLAHMKPDAWLINVGRGALVDESALIQALRSKTLGGAALDVFDTEPLPSRLAPMGFRERHHHAACCRYDGQNLGAAFRIFQRESSPVSGGQPLLGVVDKTKGY